MQQRCACAAAEAVSVEEDAMRRVAVDEQEGVLTDTAARARHR